MPALCAVAEWLRSGLQSRLHRFDSGRRLSLQAGSWRPCREACLHLTSNEVAHRSAGAPVAVSDVAARAAASRGARVCGPTRSYAARVLATVREHSFFTAPLVPGATVVDLGANVGDFTSDVSRRFAVSSLAVEANSDLVGGIERSPSVPVRHAAVAPTNGPVDFHIAEHSVASSVYWARGHQHVRTDTVDGVTFAALLDAEGIDAPALVKV